MKKTSKSLAIETKFAIADAIANTFASLVGADENVRRAVYANVLNDAKFQTTSGQVHTLASYCGKEDALHITRLVMRRLTSPSVYQSGIARVS